MHLKKKQLVYLKGILIFALSTVSISNCLIIRNNKLNPPDLNKHFVKNKLKLTISMHGCYPEEQNSCKFSSDNYELINKVLAKSGKIEQLNANSSELINSDYHLDFYWTDNKNGPKEGITGIISMFSLFFIPTYRIYEINLLVIVKKPKGILLRTLEYNESFITIRHNIFIFALPFQKLNEEEVIKTTMLELLLKDLSKIENSN